MTTSKDSTATTERKPSTKPSSKWMQYMTEAAQAYAKTVAGTVTDSENRAAKESQSEAMRLVANQAQRVDPADLGITTENAEQELDRATARQKEIQAQIPSTADNPAQLKKVLTEWHSMNLLREAANNVQRSARKQQGEADRLRETSERLAAENQRKRRQDDRAARLKNLDANPLVDESLDRRESELKTAIDAGDATRARQLLNPFIIQSQKLGLSTQAGMKAGNIVFSHNNDVQRLESMTSPNDLRQFASTQKDWAGRNAEKKQEVQDWLASLPDEQLRWLSDAPGGHYYGFDASRVLQRRTDGGSAQPAQPASSTPAPEFAPASVRDVRSAMHYPPGEFQTMIRNQGITRQVGTDDILTGEEIEQILSKPGLGYARDEAVRTLPKPATEPTVVSAPGLDAPKPFSVEPPEPEQRITFEHLGRDRTAGIMVTEDGVPIPDQRFYSESDAKKYISELQATRESANNEPPQTTAPALAPEAAGDTTPDTQTSTHGDAYYQKLADMAVESTRLQREAHNDPTSGNIQTYERAALDRLSNVTHASQEDVEKDRALIAEDVVELNYQAAKTHYEADPSDENWSSLQAIAKDYNGIASKRGHMAGRYGKILGMGRRPAQGSKPSSTPEPTMDISAEPTPPAAPAEHRRIKGLGVAVNEHGEMYFPDPPTTKKMKAAQARTDEDRLASVRRENQLEQYAKENDRELQRVNSQITHLHRNDPPLPEDVKEREGLQEYRAELQQRRIWIELDLRPIQTYHAGQKEYDRLDEAIREAGKKGNDAKRDQLIKLQDDIDIRELRLHYTGAKSNLEEKMQGGEAEKFYTLPRPKQTQADTDASEAPMIASMPDLEPEPTAVSSLDARVEAAVTKMEVHKAEKSESERVRGAKHQELVDWVQEKLRSGEGVKATFMLSRGSGRGLEPMTYKYDPDSADDSPVNVTSDGRLRIKTGQHASGLPRYTFTNDTTTFQSGDTSFEVGDGPPVMDWPKPKLMPERVVTYTGPGGGPAGTVVTDLDADIAKAERDTQKAQREFEAKSAKVLNATPETHSMKQRRNLRIASDQAAQGLRTTRLRLEALKAAQGVEVPAPSADLHPDLGNSPADIVEFKRREDEGEREAAGVAAAAMEARHDHGSDLWAASQCGAACLLRAKEAKAGQDAVMLEESRGDVDMGGEYTLRGGAASVLETPIDRLSEIEAMPEWATVQAKDLHQAYTPEEKALLSEHSDLRRTRHLSEAEANFPEQERSEIVQTLIAAKESELRAEGMSDSDVGEEIQHLTQLYSQRSPTAKTGPSALDERERLLKIIESAQQKSAVTATPTIITAAPNAGPEPQPINISITVIDDNDTLQPPPVMQTIEEQAETRTAAAAAAKPKKKSAPKSSAPSLASCAPENVTNTIEGLALELKLQEEELDKVQASTGSKGGVSKLERLELAQKAVSKVQRRIRTEEKKLGVACPLPAATKKGPSAYAQAGKRAAKGRTGTHPAVKLRNAVRSSQRQRSGARG